MSGRGADLHMAQLMLLPFTVSCSSKSRLVLPFWYWLTRVVMVVVVVMFSVFLKPFLKNFSPVQQHIGLDLCSLSLSGLVVTLAIAEAWVGDQSQYRR